MWLESGSGMIEAMLMRLCYSALRCVLDGLALFGRRRVSLQAEVLVLRHENAILRRGSPRPKLAWWGTKEAVLRQLDDDAVPVPVRGQVRDLIVASLQRPYRCKDWRYARLVRHLADPLLSDQIGALLAFPDPLVRLRAAFVADLVRQPDHRVHRHTWQRWLTTHR